VLAGDHDRVCEGLFMQPARKRFDRPGPAEAGNVAGVNESVTRGQADRLVEVVRIGDADDAKYGSSYQPPVSRMEFDSETAHRQPVELLVQAPAPDPQECLKQWVRKQTQPLLRD
jgi:hypothetical protein